MAFALALQAVGWFARQQWITDAYTFGNKSIIVFQIVLAIWLTEF